MAKSWVELRTRFSYWSIGEKLDIYLWFGFTVCLGLEQMVSVLLARTTAANKNNMLCVTRIDLLF